MKNLNLYSLLFSIFGIILLYSSQYLADVYGDLSRIRSYTAILAAIIGCISLLSSIILGFLNVKENKNKSILRNSGLIVSLIFIFGVILMSLFFSLTL